MSEKLKQSWELFSLSCIYLQVLFFDIIPLLNISSKTTHLNLLHSCFPQNFHQILGVQVIVKAVDLWHSCMSDSHYLHSSFYISKMWIITVTTS